MTISVHTNSILHKKKLNFREFYKSLASWTNHHNKLLGLTGVDTSELAGISEHLSRALTIFNNFSKFTTFAMLLTFLLFPCFGVGASKPPDLFRQWLGNVLAPQTIYDYILTFVIYCIILQLVEQSAHGACRTVNIKSNTLSLIYL